MGKDHTLLSLANSQAIQFLHTFQTVLFPRQNRVSGQHYFMLQSIEGFLNELEKTELVVTHTLHTTNITDCTMPCTCMYEVVFGEDGNVPNSSITGGKMTLTSIEGLCFCTHTSSTNSTNT